MNKHANGVAAGYDHLQQYLDLEHLRKSQHYLHPENPSFGTSNGFYVCLVNRYEDQLFDFKACECSEDVAVE